MTRGAPERGSGARLALAGARVTKGPRSFVTYLRLTRSRRCAGSRGTVVRVRLRELGGRPMAIRPGTSDVDTVHGTFTDGAHRPPAEALDRDLLLIWDLGANIGLTMADLAVRHPRARVVGLEMDAENAALARENTSAWGDRCEVIEAAAWPTDGQLGYVHRAGAAPQEDGSAATTDALSPFSLLALAPDAVVDFARIDIDGAEAELLRHNAGWAHRVRTMVVEVHAPYTVGECRDDLRELGFETRVDPDHRACVIAYRDLSRLPHNSAQTPA